jgi:hypothetical protein
MLRLAGSNFSQVLRRRAARRWRELCRAASCTLAVAALASQMMLFLVPMLGQPRPGAGSFSTAASWDPSTLCLPSGAPPKNGPHDPVFDQCCIVCHAAQQAFALAAPRELLLDPPVLAVGDPSCRSEKRTRTARRSPHRNRARRRGSPDASP